MAETAIKIIAGIPSLTGSGETAINLVAGIPQYNPLVIDLTTDIVGVSVTPDTVRFYAVALGDVCKPVLTSLTTERLIYSPRSLKRS